MHEVKDLRNRSHTQRHIVQAKARGALDFDGRRFPGGPGGEGEVIIRGGKAHSHTANSLPGQGGGDLIDPFLQSGCQCGSHIVPRRDVDDSRDPVDRHVEAVFIVGGG